MNSFDFPFQFCTMHSAMPAKCSPPKKISITYLPWVAFRHFIYLWSHTQTRPCIVFKMYFFLYERHILLALIGILVLSEDQPVQPTHQPQTLHTSQSFGKTYVDLLNPVIILNTYFLCILNIINTGSCVIAQWLNSWLASAGISYGW